MRYGKGERVVPEDRWEQRVIEDNAVWSEYGVPFDIRSALPSREYRAHLAIIEGIGERRKKQQKEAEREADKAK